MGILQDVVVLSQQDVQVAVVVQVPSVDHLERPGAGRVEVDPTISQAPRRKILERVVGHPRILRSGRSRYGRYDRSQKQESQRYSHGKPSPYALLAGQYSTPGSSGEREKRNRRPQDCPLPF